MMSTTGGILHWSVRRGNSTFLILIAPTQREGEREVRREIIAPHNWVRGLTTKFGQERLEPWESS